MIQTLSAREKGEQNRQKIIQFFQQNPTNSYSAKEIGNMLGMGIGSASSHCDLLCRQNKLQETSKFNSTIQRRVRAYQAI